MNTFAEDMAFRLAGLVGDLAAVVEWCVDRDGECLGDNPRQLAIAKRVLLDARKLLPPAKAT